MPDPTLAQAEFERLISNNAASTDAERLHPEDRADISRDRDYGADELDEEERHRASRIEAAMRMSGSSPSHASNHIKLPPSTFDSGRSTGVKGVIADARHFETARRNKWAGQSVPEMAPQPGSSGGVYRGSFIHSDDARIGGSGPGSSGGGDDEEGAFIQQWRESRRRELEDESRNASARYRRTSPSLRMFGSFDEVDALEYLDAIEKVGRETVVAVFVYDHECPASVSVEHALRPLVSLHPAVHFVKVYYDDIEFDNAGVPAVLAYRNQGDLFANLTGIVDLISQDEGITVTSLQKLFQRHKIF